MMTEIVGNPILGMILSLSCFLLGKKINERMKHPVFNPILITMVLVIVFLKVFNINYEQYKEQNAILGYLLGPATVALAVPLYKNIDILKKNLSAILIGVLTGCIVSIASIMGLGILLGADMEIILSMGPKAVTTPIAMEISRVLGGIPSLTAGLVAITGIFGACFAPEILRFFGIKNKIAMGIAIGTATHALGTTRAFELGEVEGSMSSLSIALAGIITALLVPYAALLIQ